MLTLVGKHSTNGSQELWCSKTWKNHSPGFDSDTDHPRVPVPNAGELAFKIRIQNSHHREHCDTEVST